jgi:sulfur-carrier protein
VADLVTALRALPGAEKLPPRPMIAVNHSYAAYEQALHPGDEVAVIPPVAGG